MLQRAKNNNSDNGIYVALYGQSNFRGKLQRLRRSHAAGCGSQRQHAHLALVCVIVRHHCKANGLKLDNQEAWKWKAA